MTNHMEPLKPGRVRSHTTRGGKTFTAMHTGNGAFVQVKGPDGVLCTLMSEDAALTVYADAIADAEAMEIAVDDIVVRRGEEDGPRGIVVERHPVEALSHPTSAFLLVSFAGRMPIAIDARNVALAGDPAFTDLDSCLAVDLARPLRDAVRRHVQGGGMQFLDALVERAANGAAFREEIKTITDRAESVIMLAPDEWVSPQTLENLVRALRDALKGE